MQCKFLKSWILTFLIRLLSITYFAAVWTCGYQPLAKAGSLFVFCLPNNTACHFSWLKCSLVWFCSVPPCCGLHTNTGVSAHIWLFWAHGEQGEGARTTGDGTQSYINQCFFDPLGWGCCKNTGLLELWFYWLELVAGTVFQHEAARWC